MKKNHLLSLALACILSVSQALYGQKVTKEEWRRQVDAQEATINDYVAKKLNGSKQEELLKQFYASTEHGDNIKMTDLPKMLDQYLKNHYRLMYFEENPGMVSIYNPGRVQLDKAAAVAPPTGTRNVACFNGNFEDDLTLAAYTGYRGPMYTSNECSFVPPVAVAYTPISLASPNEFQLTNNVADPMIPGLNQTNNGSAHAMKINGPGPCSPNRGINMLQRSFTTPTAGLYQINFSYALVMENPKNHPNAQPFFVARILNGAGVEIGSRICRISDLTNPIYNITGSVPNPTGCGTTDSLVWRDWTCAFIRFQGDPSQTYTIEFFAADCAAGAHFGYAYVDDICASECCPKFFMSNCCDMHGGSSSGNAARKASVESPGNKIVQQVLAQYNERMNSKYNLAASRGAADPCCNPCAYPNDPYPVFIMDEFNTLISSTDYIISWSHDPGNTSAYAFILPNQQTVITVKGPGNCVWTDTVKLNCCNDTIKITPFCTWNPCDHPNSPFPVRVLDQNGNTLTSAGGYTFLWQYGSGPSTGDAITATLADFPIIVTVKDSTCEYTDTLDINCCQAITPINLKCQQVTSGSQLSWTPVPGATYKLVITTNDPSCCAQGIGASYVFPIAVTNTVIPSSFANCFSWYVVAICPDGTESPASAKLCSCSPPACVAKVPDNLLCTPVTNGSLISWNPVPGATYKVIITANDPACCHNSLPVTVTSWVIASTSTVVPTTVAGCFSWQVISICPDGTQSAASAKKCSCSPVSCIANTPENLKCSQVSNGSVISWDPVPGTTYQVVINVNDPACCPQGLPPSTIVWNVASTNTLVPTTVAGCFSWYVIAICPDGTQSVPSGKKCSCSPVTCVANTPENLKCSQVSNGSVISWDPVPGTTYQVVINVNDPACCPQGLPPSTIVWNVASTNTLVPTTVAGCFSWYVIAICPDGTHSAPSGKKCSCSPVVQCTPKVPGNLKCNQDANGSAISWDPVPGATYQVVINAYDPDCCGDVGIHPFTIVWNVATTNTLVPTTVAGCFSWYVVSICPDGSTSAASVKMCSCSPIVQCIPKVPDNLKCNPTLSGSLISWDPVPGATYKLIVTTNDPACCHTTQLGASYVFNIAATSTVIPTSFAGCFSWYVIAICPDGSSSAASVLMCSCSPVVVAQCDDPYKLKCSVIQNQTQLGWSAGGLATGYELEITYNDPTCCRSMLLSYTTTYPLTATTFWVPSTGWTCFSWRVRAVCPGGYSNWVNGGCNCLGISTPGFPTSKMNQGGDNTGSTLGTDLRVEAVPNPASDYVDFTLSGTENLQNQSLEISIYDITGREVSRKPVNADGKVRFEVYSLSTGLYIYKLTRNGELFYSGKMMIDKK